MIRRVFLVLFILLVTKTVLADRVVRELGQVNGEPEPYVVPYGFVSEAMGFVGGVQGVLAAYYRSKIV